MRKIYVLPAAATKQKRLRSKMIFCLKSKNGNQSAAKLGKVFFDSSSQRHADASRVEHEASKRVFIKMNTQVTQLKERFRLKKTLYCPKDRS